MKFKMIFLYRVSEKTQHTYANANKMPSCPSFIGLNRPCLVHRLTATTNTSRNSI